MRKKYVIINILIIILLLGTNFATLIMMNQRVHTKNKELKEAYELILAQNKEIDKLEEERNALVLNEKALEEKNKNLVQTYQKLTGEFELLKSKSEDLEEQITEKDQMMQQYSYVFNYDPVTLEEYQVYIQELENKILDLGGFDKYEQPGRWKEYDDIVIWLEDGSSVKWADQVHEKLELLPQKIIETLNDNGWMVILTPRNLEDVYESGVQNTVGLTIYYHSRIYLQNNEFSIDYCTIHEIGHALDFINNFISSDEDWKLIYETEAKDSGLDSYFTSSSSEYFSEMFQSYFINPELMKENAPLSYEYMDKFVASFD